MLQVIRAPRISILTHLKCLIHIVYNPLLFQNDLVRKGEINDMVGVRVFTGGKVCLPNLENF